MASKNTLFYPIIKCFYHKLDLTPKLHFLVVRYGALCLCFHGIVDYLRGFVCVYEYSVIDGALVASSMSVWCTFNIQLYTVY